MERYWIIDNLFWIILILTIISILLNVLFGYTIYKSSSIYISNYRFYLYLYVIMDLLYSISHFISLPCAIEENTILVFAYVGISRYSNYLWGEIAVYFFNLGMAATIVLIANCFIYRYAILCNITLQQLLQKIPFIILLILINFFVFIGWFYGVRYGMGPHPIFETALSNVVYETVQMHLSEHYYLGVSAEVSNIDILRQPASTVIILLCIIDLLIIFFCSDRILRKLRKSGTMSSAARKYHWQMLRLLFIQFAVPFIFYLLPIFLVFLFPLILNISMPDILQIGITLCFPMLPVLNPLVSIYFVKEYNQYIVKRIKQMVNIRSRDDSTIVATTRNTSNIS